MKADLIVFADEHRDWDLSDATLVNQSSLALSLEVPGGILLEPVHVCVLGPVGFALNGRSLAAFTTEHRVAELLANLIADFDAITRPIWPVESVDSDFGEPHQRLRKVALRCSTGIVHSARSESNERMHVVGEELFVKLGECVKELNRPLRHAEIEDFLSAGVLLDSLDIGNVVIYSHLGPGPCPELRLVHGETGVPLRVL